MTISAVASPLRTWADSLLRIPSVTGRLAAVPSCLIDHHKFADPIRVRLDRFRRDDQCIAGRAAGNRGVDWSARLERSFCVCDPEPNLHRRAARIKRGADQRHLGRHRLGDAGDSDRGRRTQRELLRLCL